MGINHASNLAADTTSTSANVSPVDEFLQHNLVHVTDFICQDLQARRGGFVYFCRMLGVSAWQHASYRMNDVSPIMSIPADSPGLVIVCTVAVSYTHLPSPRDS